MINYLFRTCWKKGELQISYIWGSRMRLWRFPCPVFHDVWKQLVISCNSEFGSLRKFYFERRAKRWIKQSWKLQNFNSSYLPCTITKLPITTNNVEPFNVLLQTQYELGAVRRDVTLQISNTLQYEYLVERLGVDAAEEGPFLVCQNWIEAMTALEQAQVNCCSLPQSPRPRRTASLTKQRPQGGT